MKRYLLILVFVLASCGGDDAEDKGPQTCGALTCTDAGTNNVTTEADSGESTDSGTAETDTGDEADTGNTPQALTATQSHEAEILYGWLAAGQPSEDRLREVVEQGAVVISLRAVAEDPFDEPALVESLGGTFIRYPTSGPDYDSVDFREGMYDLYDEQLDAGNLVYLHCASSNRVGASWALYQAERKGVPAEEAIQMGRDAGLSSLESRVRAVLEL